jgi:ATP-binding cassette subfamily C protein
MGQQILNKIPSQFKKLYGLFDARERLKMVGLLFLMLIAAILEVAGIGMIPGFVTIVTDPETVMKYEPIENILKAIGVTNSRELLIWGSLALVGIFLIKNIYLVAYHYIEKKFLYNRMYHISHRLMKSYMQAPYTFHLKRNVAELLRNINEECRLLIDRVLMPFFVVLKEGGIGLAIVIFLVFMEPFITLIVFVMLGTAIGFFLFFTQERIKKYGEEEQYYRGEMIRMVNQGLGGIKDARILNREMFFVEKFREKVRRATQLRTYIRFISQIPKPAIETFAVTGIMIIAFVMVLQERPLKSIIPILSLFAMATVRLMPAIQKIAKSYTTLSYNIVSVNPVYDDLNELSEYQSNFIADRKKENKFEFSDSLNFDNVYYQYPNSEEYALDGVSFEISKGEAIGFVGASGAGKSTLVDVMLGLLKSTKGTISIDGKNIYKNLSAWQQNIGYIPQSIYISDESLRNNIAFGIPEDEIEDENVRKAIRLAKLEEHVQQLPNGLDTVIGERGKLLSGGQQQRVGIARALYHDPQFLVMDEATSSLDNVTEKYIMSSIERLKGDRTIIIIAHRLTTVKKCDTLYFMENGKIIQQGTYSKLIETNKKFREMAQDIEN